MLTDLFRLQLDLLGARAELAAALISNWLLNRATPRASGDRPVITFPGFLASESTLLRLNKFLNRHGYSAEGWGLGRNLGPRGRTWDAQLDELVTFVGDRIRRLADEHSSPVALIGQSLGGVYARELALHLPTEVDRVIMLGSPTFHPYVTSHHNRVISMFGHWLSRQSRAELAGRRGLLHWDPSDPPLPCISFHSPIDGVVDESSSIIPHYIVSQSDPLAPRENLRVLSSHVGMGVNPWVMLAIADRLAADKEVWTNFDPYRYFPESLRWAVALLFPAQAEQTEEAGISILAEGSR